MTEFMDFEYLKKNTGINLTTMASIAKAPMKPENVSVITSNLTNKTDLTWNAPSKGKKPERYNILMRKTASQMWEKSFSTKDTKVTLPYSKDNYFFAVQAIGADGNASLPVILLPIK